MPFTLSLSNRFPVAIASMHARVVIPAEFDAGNPPFVGAPPPGATWDEASRTLAFSGALPASGRIDVDFRLRLAAAARCLGVLTATGGVDSCNNLSASFSAFRVANPPPGPHIVGLDYIDGLWTFQPGVDTDFQPLLCFNFSGSGSGGIGRSAAGDIYLSHQPPLRFNPSRLELEALPLPSDVSDIAFDEASGQLLLLYNDRIDRYDPHSQAVTRIADAPPGVFLSRSIVAGVDGRIAFLGSQELRILDPRPPATLPIPAADILQVALPTFQGASAAPQSVLSLARDSRGDYLVNCAYADNRRAIVKIDHATLAGAVLFAGDVNAPTAGCLAVGPQGEAFAGSASGELQRIAFGPPPTLLNLRTTNNSHLGALDIVSTQPGALPGSCQPDFNADGVLDPDDLSDYITCYFALPPCPRADINADGAVDPDDLSDFITAYFAGC